MAFCTNCGSSMEGQFCTKCGSRTGEAAAPVVQTTAPHKSKALIWVLAGCGGLIAIILVVGALVTFFIGRHAREFGKNPGFAAARMMASMNPNVEVLNADEGTGKITLRDRKSGKTVTLDFDEIRKGHISFEGDNGEKVDIRGEGDTGSMTIKSSEGTVQIGQGSSEKIPNWVPKYPGGQVTGAFAAQHEGAESGGFQVKCSGLVEQVAAFYEKELASGGMRVEKHSVPGTMVSVVGTDDAGHRSVTVTVTSSGEGTVAHIVYGAK